MPNVKVTINERAAAREIKAQLHKDARLNRELQRKADRNFERIKRDFIAEFMAHEVTSELGSGSGELFAFIGFPRGSNPITPLLSLLEDRISIIYRKFNRRGRAQFTINLPSETEIVRRSPMPWAAGISWAKGIENGIPDFGKLLEVEGRSSSRSGGGIQAAGDINNRQFSRQPYVFHMLSKYIKIFSKFGFRLK
jgi:hypothetical protein